MSDRRLILAVSFWPTGAVNSGWRLAEADNRGIFSPRLLADAARTAERGVFDYFFLGNSENSDPSKPGAVARRAFQLNGIAAASFLAGQTRDIGLVATVNTSYAHPFAVAQQASAVDHLSEGRFGLNLVSGFAGHPGHLNLGGDGHPATDDKYDRADEFIRVFNDLQDSWEDGWLLDDRDGGRLFDPASAHPIDFDGRFFRVEGPLNAPRSPQGRIPIIHAGTSERSLEYGAAFADVRFSRFVGLDATRAWSAEQRRRAAAYGRDPEQYRIVVGTIFYPGETDAEARRIFRETERALVDDFAPAAVAGRLGIDAARITAHGRVAEVLDVTDETLDPVTRWVVGQAIAAYDSPEITFLDLFRFLSNRFDFPVVVGGPGRIADWIEEGFTERAFDGVKFFPPFQRQPFDAFVGHVVPELQRRGLARTAYDSHTLRGHLGIPRPRSVFEGTTSANAETPGRHAHLDSAVATR